MAAADGTAPGVSAGDGRDGKALGWVILRRCGLSVIWARASGGIEAPRNGGDVGEAVIVPLTVCVFCVALGFRLAGASFRWFVRQYVALQVFWALLGCALLIASILFYIFDVCRVQHPL